MFSRELRGDGTTPSIDVNPNYIPSVDDRKRFLGCLAVVIASRYEYEDDVAVRNLAADALKRSGSDRSNKTLLRKKSSTVLSESQRKRYRERRYQVLSDLLLSAGKSLQLDESYAEGCFLPMLDSLLQGPIHQLKDLDDIELTMQRRNRANSEESATSVILKATNPYRRRDVFDAKMKQISNIQPFLQDMTPGAGIQCLSIFMIKHLLLGGKGYDARVRHCIKTLGVLIFIKDSEDYLDEQMPIDVLKFATFKFEALECTIAKKLILLSHLSSHVSSNQSQQNLLSNAGDGIKRRSTLIKGMKIGGAAVAAGVLFALTAGMAAPAIAGLAAVPGVAAVASATAVTASAAAILTSHASVAALFGLGGGSLAAYKMKRRVSGLTEFEIIKEASGSKNKKQQRKHARYESLPKETPGGELFSTVCVSGWLHDDKDFQRPWGVTPSRPPITDRTEILQRFYSIYNPKKIPMIPKILKEYKKKWGKLCRDLRKKYGSDPYHIFPLKNGKKTFALLSKVQQRVIDQLFYEIGCGSGPPISSSNNLCASLQPTQHGNDVVVSACDNLDARNGIGTSNDRAAILTPDSLYESLFIDSNADLPIPATMEQTSNDRPAISSPDSFYESLFMDNNTDLPIPATKEHNPESGAALESLNTSQQSIPAVVWDYETSYGGELYTIRWESHLIKEISDSIKQLGYEFLLSNGATELLKQTALSGLMTALAVPRLLASATNIIGGPWTFAVERADDAGKELARCLLMSNAGNRPVTLVGFSFGARVIYSCLKELAVYQEKWEDYRMGISATTSSHNEDASSPNEELVNNSKDLTDDDDLIKKIREPASVVEDAIILGLPARFDMDSWESCRQVVGGRFVHGFSRKDWVLSLMFQYKQIGLKPVCGTCPVNVFGVENVDLTDIVNGHQEYLYKIGAILERIRHCEPFRSDAPSYITSMTLDDEDLMLASMSE